MPITEDQVKFYLSGGSNNSDVFASIGGAKSETTQIRQDEFNNLWGDLGALDLKEGVTQYRAVYLKNESNNTVFENPRSYFAIKDAYVSIQFTKLGVNKRVAQLANERTAPPEAEVGSAGPPPPPETVKKFTIPAGNTTAIGSLPDHAAELATDGIKTTSWRYNVFPAWLMVDLGVVKYIHYLTLQWTSSASNPITMVFNVETSTDNITWTIRFTGSHVVPINSPLEEKVSFEHHNARYVRVTVASTTHPSKIMGIAMLDVFGVSERALDIGGWEGATEDFATTQSACPNVPPLSYIGLWLRRVIPPNDVAFPTLKQTMKLQVVGGGGALPPSTEPPPVEPPPVEPPPVEPPPGGGGGTGTGPYPSTGKQLGSTTRRATRHYASGKADDETIEKNTKSIPYQHYQSIHYVTMHGIEHDDNVSIKLGGTHMGSGWFDHGISFSGKTCLGTEPNHPDTNSCIKTGPNIGSILNKRIGISAIFRRPNTHTELWYKLPNGNWIKALQNTGPLGGFTPDEDGGHEVQLRIDGFEDGDDPTIDVAVVQEIAPA